MKHKIILFKDFNAALPEEFVNAVNDAVPEAVILTVRGQHDFDRWSFNYRVSNDIIKVITAINEKHDNILVPYLEVVTTSSDPFSGVIEFDDDGKESWKKS